MMLDLSQSKTWSAEVGRAGIEVRVASGEIWITRERDREDYVLTAPETFDSTWKGRLVVYALSPSRLEVKPLAERMFHAGQFAQAASR